MFYSLSILEKQDVSKLDDQTLSKLNKMLLREVYYTSGIDKQRLIKLHSEILNECFKRGL